MDPPIFSAVYRIFKSHCVLPPHNERLSFDLFGKKIQKQVEKWCKRGKLVFYFLTSHTISNLSTYLESLWYEGLTKNVCN